MQNLEHENNVLQAEKEAIIARRELEETEFECKKQTQLETQLEIKQALPDEEKKRHFGTGRYSYTLYINVTSACFHCAIWSYVCSDDTSSSHNHCSRFDTVKTLFYFFLISEFVWFVKLEIRMHN